MSEDIEVEVVVNVRAELGEGPVWDDRRGLLLWLDVLRHRVYRYDPATDTNEMFDVGLAVGSVALSNAAHLILAMEDGFWRFNPDTDELTQIVGVEANDPGTRMNDGNVDAQGRFWAGTMSWEERPGAGTVYRLDPDGSVRPIIPDITISNGIDWSPDSTLMYYIDTPSRGIDVFDFDASAGACVNRRRLVSIPEDQGWPDGLHVDADGHIWVALYGGSAIHRYRPDGALDLRVHLPTPKITSLAFGGPGLEDLYVTSALEHFTAEERASEPHAGALFRCRPGCRGRAPYRFAG